MISLICSAFSAMSIPGSFPKRSCAFCAIESGVGMMAIKIKMTRPMPSHLKSVVLAKPPLLLLFVSPTVELNVCHNGIEKQVKFLLNIFIISVSYLVLFLFRVTFHCKMIRIRQLVSFYFMVAVSIAQDSSRVNYQYSQILTIPDLSFFNQVYTGLDILEQMDFAPVRSKKIGILTNHTAVNRNGDHILDLLKNEPSVNVHVLFEPEYGIWGLDDKRAKLVGRERVDPVHGARIINIFDGMVYPPRWAMAELDLILIDLQDTGIRYSTFIASVSKLFEAASDWKIPVMILDRPNPLRGDIVDGPVPRTEFQSLEAYHLFPIRHGLTLGEACILINEIGWVKDSKHVELTIVPMANWKRDTWFDQTQLSWKHPIPFIRDSETLLAYAGMDLFRGTNLNAGFGTDHPYLYVGAPWLVANFFLEKLNDFGLRGVLFEEIKYRPRGSIYYNRVPKYDGQSCSGIKMSITDKNEFDPISTATSMIMLIHHLHPREFQWTGDGYIDKLFGSDLLRTLTAQNKSPEMLPPQWVHDVYLFNQFRQPYLIYP